MLTGGSFAAALPKIGIGQIGTDHSHAEGKMASIRSLNELYVVRGFAESNEARRAQATKQAAFAGLSFLTEQELLDDPNVQVIAVETGIDALTATAHRCVKAGKHIHLDKPASVDHASFAAMRREAEQRGLIVQMGYMLRHNPAFEFLFRAVREGWLGEIMEIDASMGKLAHAGLRKSLGAMPGGGMFELACHVVDAALTILGPPKGVIAVSTPTQDDGFKDNQLAVLEYAQASVTIRCNHADPFGNGHRRFKVVGTKGAVEIMPLESGKMTLSLSAAKEGYVKGTQAVQLPIVGGRYDGEFRTLAKSIQTKAPFPWTADHDISVHETVLKASGIK